MITQLTAGVRNKEVKLLQIFHIGVKYIVILCRYFEMNIWMSERYILTKG